MTKTFTLMGDYDNGGNWCVTITPVKEKYGTDIVLKVFPAHSSGPMSETTIYLPMASKKELIKFANSILTGCK